MTVHALAEFPLDGFQHFRQSFVDNVQSAAECESARVFSSGGGDDEEPVAVLMRWADRDTYARFRAEMERDMASGGDMAPGVLSEPDDDAGAVEDALRGLTETEDLVETRHAVSRSGG